MGMSAPPAGAGNVKISGGNAEIHGFRRNATDALSTKAALRAWSNGSSTPPKRPPSGLSKFTYWNGEKLTGSVATGFLPAMVAIDAVMKKHRYHPIEKLGLWGFCHRLIRGSKSSWSAHSFGCAIDVNSVVNPYITTFKTDMPPAMVNEILALRTRNGKPVVTWGGWFGVGRPGGRGRTDAMHFQVACGPKDLATGIVGSTGPGTGASTSPISTPERSTGTTNGDELMATQKELEIMREMVWSDAEVAMRVDRGRWLNDAERSAWRANLWHAPLTLDGLRIWYQRFLNQLSKGVTPKV